MTSQPFLISKKADSNYNALAFTSKVFMFPDNLKNQQLYLKTETSGFLLQEFLFV